MNQRVKSSSQKTCKIKQGTPLTELLKKTYLIMWDEAPIANRNCIETLDKSLKDILIFNNENIDKKKILEGMTVVLGGDFRKSFLLFPKEGEST